MAYVIVIEAGCAGLAAAAPLAGAGVPVTLLEARDREATARDGRYGAVDGALASGRGAACEAGAQIAGSA